MNTLLEKGLGKEVSQKVQTRMTEKEIELLTIEESLRSKKYFKDHPAYDFENLVKIAQGQNDDLREMVGNYDEGTKEERFAHKLHQQDTILKLILERMDYTIMQDAETAFDFMEKYQSILNTQSND